MNFDSLGLKATLLQAVAESGYTTPTTIQQQAIPGVLSGRDLMAAAQTGTGKTAGFTLPLLQLLGGRDAVRSNHVRALILTPTRELAAQIQESIETYGKHEKVRSAVVFGGVNINPQQMALRKGVDILVATPGRLLDLYQQNAVKFGDIEILVLDEADRMLDMGFIRDIRKIMNLLPKKRQNLMFSATFSPDIRALAKTICHDALEIDVAPRNSTVEKISQQIYMVNKERKLPLLGKLLTETADQVLVFSRTKHGANNLVKKLAGYGVQSAAIHGNKSQAQRTKALGDFKANRTQVLVATDIAARGIDIDQLALVINYDLPQVPEDYVHRIGRTGRAGASGVAVSLVTDEDNKLLRDIERLIKLRIERKEFDPATLPQSTHIAQPEEAARPARSSGGRGSSRGQRNTSQGRSSSPERSASQGRGTSQERSAAPGQRRRTPRTGNSNSNSNSNGNSSGNRNGNRSGNVASGGNQAQAGRTGSQGKQQPRQQVRTTQAGSTASASPQGGLWASLKGMLGATN